MNKPITIMLPIVPPTKTHQNKKIVNIGKHAKLADTKELKLVISDYHGEPRIMYGVEDAIRDAWQKRAACRAWIPPQQRGCFTCKHDGTHYKLCALCYGVGWPISWEPKKEASND